jgi:hypothetical protein
MNTQYLISCKDNQITYTDISNMPKDKIDFLAEQHELHGNEVYYQNFLPLPPSDRVEHQLILLPLSVLLQEQRLQGFGSASHPTNAHSGSPVARVK